MQRISAISSHLSSNPGLLASLNEKHADDVVICSALRTCLSKAKRGPLRETPPEIMIAEVLKAIQKETKVDPKLVEDMVMGNVLQPGAGAVQTRLAQLLTGFPVDSTAVAINRLCSSGIESVSMVAAKIKSGVIDCGIAGGVESMSMYNLPDGRYPKMSADAMKNDWVQRTYVPDGTTSENVVEKYGQTREELDQFAVNSHLKAAHATKMGYFKDEIVPIKAKYQDKDGNEVEELANTDGGIRANSSMAALAKLKPAFKKGGVTTGGNSSQLTDGAACVLLARRSVAEKHGLPVIGRFCAYATAGVPPEIMGVGPAYAIPECMKRAGMKIEDVDLWEINEAFASQAKHCVDKLGIDHKKVNVKGGAIALGHPLAATGARMVATLLPELKRTGKKVGGVSMCIGTGMGACAIIVRE